MDDGNLGEIVYWLYIKDNEVDWKIEFIHFNENISINSRDTFTDRSTNYKVSDAGLGSPKEKRPYTELGNKFTLAPRSNKALSMVISPMA